MLAACRINATSSLLSISVSSDTLRLVILNQGYVRAAEDKLGLGCRVRVP